ncbi:hypothetical protein M501DRAFT_1015391 [Patellaria atrata CBS 101060]|uniref:BTB domain-containing protein n=1 Tax=Patellaria atrata CBS 101060 TaxID=1346257 RepID=A0A9P4SCT1_9PEZI|nr:hypothetical protein M501DRAFT_1015391 [Patellaria atrata CBS 101060]
MAQSEKSKPRPKALHELLTHSMVDLYVGPENTRYILHERLLCYHSPFFRKVFYSPSRKATDSKAFGLPDEDETPFKIFVGWLYSDSIRSPKAEKDLGDLFDLYLMAEKWGIENLIRDVLRIIRDFYRETKTYPGLRRVQYIYANTDDSSPMRHLLVSSIARMMTIGEGIPMHWDKALKKNGQLAVDIIRAIQGWRLEEETVPDAREEELEEIEVDDRKKKHVEREAEKEIKKNEENPGLVNGGNEEEMDQAEQQEQEQDDDDEDEKTMVASASTHTSSN